MEEMGQDTQGLKSLADLVNIPTGAATSRGAEKKR